MSYESFVNNFSKPKPGEFLCEFCRLSFPPAQLIATGNWEMHTLDLDPGTRICLTCHEARCEAYTPDDPALFDCWTPVKYNS